MQNIYVWRLIGSNPFHCNCHLEDFVDFLQGIQTLDHQILYYKEPQCTSPSYLSGIKLVDVSFEDINCTDSGRLFCYHVKCFDQNWFTKRYHKYHDRLFNACYMYIYVQKLIIYGPHVTTLVYNIIKWYYYLSLNTYRDDYCKLYISTYFCIHQFMTCSGLFIKSNYLTLCRIYINVPRMLM